MTDFVTFGAISPLIIVLAGVLLVLLLFGPLVLGTVLIRERVSVTGANASPGLVDGLLGLMVQNQTGRQGGKPG